jgi:opine dehydrogenase
VTDRPNVTICGCGSGGMAMAADLAMLGCRVNLYETPAFAANLEPIRERRGIALSGLPFSGKTGLARMNKITSDATEALEGSELVFINVPAMAVGSCLEHLAPHFLPGQVVVVTTSYWASFRYRDLLRATGAFDKYTFVEMVIMPYLSGKVGPAEVEIGNWKRELFVSSWPAAGNARAIEAIRKVYP